MHKIAILDSGLGGFSILREIILRKLDTKSYFISDNLNVPYGDKSQKFMLDRLELMVTKALKMKVDAILIACNTATAETIDTLRSRFDIPFIGIEPYINYLHHSSNERLGLILTKATFKSKRFNNLRETLDPTNSIKIYPLDKLALIIEKFYTNDFSSLIPSIKNELSSIDFRCLDSLILGCTHYPLISNFLNEEYNVKVIDPNSAVVDHLTKTLSLGRSQEVDQYFYYSRNPNEKLIQTKLSDYNIFH